MLHFTELTKVKPLLGRTWIRRVRAKKRSRTQAHANKHTRVNAGTRTHIPPKPLTKYKTMPFQEISCQILVPSPCKMQEKRVGSLWVHSALMANCVRTNLHINKNECELMLSLSIPLIYPSLQPLHIRISTMYLAEIGPASQWRSQA